MDYICRTLTVKTNIRMLTHKKQTTDNSEIRIYERLPKSLLMSLLCLMFAVGGIFILRDDSAGTALKIIGGWLNILFFGLGGLFMLGSTLLNKIKRIPSLIIRDDCVCIHIPLKNKYDIILFKNVNSFSLIKPSMTKLISVNYKSAEMIKEFDRSSHIEQLLMTFNYRTINALKSIPAENLTLSAKRICAILNSKLVS